VNSPLVRSFALGLAGAALLIAILVAVFAHKDFARDPHYAGTPIDPPKVAMDAILTDQADKPEHILDGSAATFVFFGYTHCPDECPLALATLGKAYRDIPATSRARTRIVFITVDPAHDTPKALAQYIAHFDTHIVALTDARSVLESVWNGYGVGVTTDPRAKELVDHGGTIFAIDATGHIVLVYPPDVKPADIAHDAQALAS
jgi:protein SCO1/2